jgi:hypothetical protein
MSIRKILAVTASVAAMYALSAPAQTNNPTNFQRLSFTATVRGVNAVRNRVDARRISERDIIRDFVGPFTEREVRGYVLVYNTATERLQVIELTNSTVGANVVDFGGGVSISDERTRERLTFVFLPNGTNSPF